MIKKIKKISLDDFTWGFEIEGGFNAEYFNDRIKGNVFEKIEKLGVRVIKKYDGSVRTHTFSGIIANTELNVGVFKSFNDMIKVLKMFNKKTYQYNNSCGLHIHIKPKKRKAMLGIKKNIFDFNFIMAIEKFGYDLCNHTKPRVSNDFCNPYFRNFKTGKFTIDEWDNEYYDLIRGNKYKFMRNHPSGTLEFRFFTPCEHKVDNLKSFFKFFVSRLDRVKTYNQVIDKILVGGENRNLDFSLKLDNESPELNFTI